MTSKVFLAGGDIIYAPFRQDKSIKINRYFDLPAGYADVQFGGAYKVTGTTAVSGSPDVPVSRLVCLMHERLKRVARSTWSDPAGNYAFNAIAYGPWTVIAWDHTLEYNAVVAANRTGEPM